MMSNDKLRTQIAALLDLKNRDASTRMRWWAVMNGWGVPEDLPEGCSDFDFGGRAVADYRSRFPRWSESMRQIGESLSEQQMSWGWWRQQGIGSFDEWSRWYGNVRATRRPPVAINELGEPK